MKIIATLLLAVAFVHANSTIRYGWTPGTESVFRFESQVLTGIPDIRNSQFSGMKLHAKVRVQAFPDYTLRIKLEQPKFITLNGEISLTEVGRIIGNGGSKSGAKEILPEEFRRHLEEPMLVHLKRGLVENFYVSKEEPVAVTNIKRSLLVQLQLDISASQRSPIETNKVDLGIGAQLSGDVSYFTVNEESLHGKCETVYNIYPLPQATALELEQKWEEEEKKAQLEPSFEGKAICQGKEYFEIIKTRNLDHCVFSPAAQHFIGGHASADVTKSHIGNLMAHMSSSTTYICGHLSDFNVRKLVVDDAMVANPVGYNTEERLKTTTRVMLELLKKQEMSAKLEIPAQTRREGSLVYTYPEEESSRHQMSAEIVRLTQIILGTTPILPQPTLFEAPKVLIPIRLPKQEIKTQIISELKKIAREVFESPDSCASKIDVSGQVLTIAKYMSVLKLQDLEEVWSQVLGGCSQPERMPTEHLLLDAIAMVGSNPSTMFIIKKIEAGQILPIKASVVIQSALKSIRTPTRELLHEFVKLVQQLKIQATTEPKKQLLISTMFQLSNVFYHAYVNPSTMVSNYPARIYGVFGTTESQVLIEYVRLLENMLQEEASVKATRLELVVISALGKLGHLDAAKPLLRVAQGLEGKEPMIRSLAVYSLKRVAKQYPTEMKAVLLAIINNPVENADVRIAAISVLPWAQPTFAELQKIAVRSWYEPSEQVSSFARSTFTSLLYTQVPGLKSVGMKVRGVMHMFKPTHYGLQYSKNIHLSNFVEYLLGTVSSKFAFTTSKREMGPTRVAMATNLYLNTLESGFMVKLGAFSAYTQGVETVIDHLLKTMEYQEGKASVIEQLAKIATEIKLMPRQSPEFIALIEQKVMGYEFAQAIIEPNAVQIMETLNNALESLKAGSSVSFVHAMNPISFTGLGMTEAGFPFFMEIDNPSVLALTASAQVHTGQEYGLLAKLVPVFNVKVQSNYGIISPLTEEFLGTGVTMSVHASSPVEVAVAAKKGELIIGLKTPEELLRKGKALETVHGFVLPYTVRKGLKEVKTINKARDVHPILTGNPIKKIDKTFNHFVNGEFRAEADKEFVDFYSYWEKIIQHNPISLLTAWPLMSSVRMSSAKLAINPALSEVKEVQLKVNLFARNPDHIMEVIAKKLGQAEEKEITSKGLKSLEKVLSELPGKPVTLVKVESLIIGASSRKVLEGFTLLGNKINGNHQTKSILGSAWKLPLLNQKAYAIVFEGEAKLPKIKSRWSKEELLNQPMELKLDAELTYGIDGEEASQRKIVVSSKMSKSEEQIKAVRESEEFKKCAEFEGKNQKLAPICMKVRHQAGSLDKFEISVNVPKEIYSSPVLKTLEELMVARYIAHFKPITPPEVPAGTIKFELLTARAGDVAQMKIMYPGFAYKLENYRVPRLLQGVTPLCIRNPAIHWVEQKVTLNRSPASCRIQPEIISTFDNRTYAYKINDCQHVLMMDGSRKYPIGVLARTIAGGKKAVKILSGQFEIELVPGGSAMEVKLDGKPLQIAKAQTFREKSSKTGKVILEVKRYEDEVYYVYVAKQFIHVVTDGQNIEIVAPHLLHGRTVGLCGDLNGEVYADLPSPMKCIMKPKYAAMSYMMNKGGKSPSAIAPACAGIPASLLPEYKREEQQCIKEIVIPTPILPLWKRIQSLNKPVVSAHMVETQNSQICISKQKIKVCSGQSVVAPEGLTSSKPLSLKTKQVEYTCVSKGTSKAESLKKRAKSGESLSVELSRMPVAYSKVEAEPVLCVPAKSAGIGGGIGGLGGSGIGGIGGSGIEGGYGGYGSSSGMGGGMHRSGGGWESGSGMHHSGSRTGGSGIGGGYGSGSRGGYGSGSGSGSSSGSGRSHGRM